MRAVLCREYGPLEKLEVAELPSPPIAPGAVRVAVHAAGINFADILIVQGKYQEKPPLPFSPGFEIAGVVTELGPGAEGVRVGDRVLGMMEHGAYADEAVLPAERVIPIPDAMDFAAAAGFPVAYGTSHGALEWRARLRAGETLLVLGAAGGVGLTAVEIGKAMGARVIAAASTPDKLEVARERGADDLVNYSTEDLTARVMALTGDKGADVCFDPVGGDLFDKALSALGWGGRMLLVGFVGGVQQIPANRLLVKNRSALGCSLRYYRNQAPDKLRRSVDALLAWYREGKLKPCVSGRLPLERTVEAIKLLTDRKAVGKIVVLPSGA